MDLSRRIRNIAKSQLTAIKDRLEKIDTEAELAKAQEKLFEAQARFNAQKELNSDLSEGSSTLRRPEEIAPPLSPAPKSTPVRTQPAVAAAPVDESPVSPMTKHYRILGLEDGADVAAVDAAYAKLCSRCAADRFPEGSDEQKAAAEILKRVEVAYSALRDHLNPTSGRFDKLEL